MAKKTIGSLNVGDIVKLNENGVPVEYLVVHQGNPDSAMYDASCDGTWLLRKYVYEPRQWHSSNSNSYAASTIHSYLNNDILGLLDAAVQSAIKHVKIPYHNNTGLYGQVDSGSNGLDAQVFLLGVYEVGFTQATVNYIPIDGACLDYFSDPDTSSNNRVAHIEGMEATVWWLRSLQTGTAVYAKAVDAVGWCTYD